MLEIKNPKVMLLHESGMGVSEIAARTCYDSFDKSENECVKNFNKLTVSDKFIEEIMKEKSEKDKDYIKDILLKNTISEIKNIENSDLLEDLAWVNHHHSVLEHINLTYYIQGTSRGVLQEHARHRIQSLSVRSTRYTMNEILFYFISSLKNENPEEWFSINIQKLDMFVIKSKEYETLLSNQLWRRLKFHLDLFQEEEFLKMSLSNENIINYHKINNSEELFSELLKGKKKRNVGDNFKDIVDDNWKTDMICTFNLRSLKNYLTLRNSGAAYFQIRILAEEIIKITPKKYLSLILKQYKKEK